MDDPIQDIRPVVHTLVQGSPREQEAAINTYFTPNASFTHPFCRTGSFEGSRLLIHSVFRWYKIMSPKIECKINSVAFDETNLILYINLSQLFAIWFVPFHRSPVTLTTQLQLTRKGRKYYIQSQNDLYQVNQFVRFFAPWGLGDAVVLSWHAFATLFCVVLAWVFTPFLSLEQAYAEKKTNRLGTRFMDRVKRVEEKREVGYEYSDEDSIVGTAADAVDGVANGVGESVDEREVKKLMGFGSEGAKEQFGNMQVIT